MKIDLQKLLDALSEGTELDTLITDEVSGQDLADIENEAIEAGRSIVDAAEKTAADADRIDAIVAVAQKVREVVGTRASAQADLDAKLAEKMALLSPAKAEEAPVEEAPAEEAPVEEKAEEKELVTAAAAKKPAKFSVADLKSRVPAPKPLATGQASHLFAAADLPNVSAGANIDLMGLAAAMSARLRALGPDTGRTIAGAHAVTAAVASLHRPDTKYMVDGTNADLLAIDQAANERNLVGGSLTAAGTWCAPSEILYDLCDDGASLEGLISFPQMRARRGGVQWTKGPDFCEVYTEAQAGFFRLTEAQVDASTVKPCFEVPCPLFEEERLDAEGFCIMGGLLMRAGYPEVIADWVRKTSIAFAHWRNASLISRAVALTENLGTIAACGAGLGGGATGSILSALELQVQSYRERHRMPFNASLELKAPFWIKSVIRADLAQRQGVDMVDVPDARINSWFASRGVAVQYLYDWQPLNSSCAAGATATAWPTNVEFMLYKAGTFVEITNPIIAIDARFDASLTETNRYGIRFQEEGNALIQRCHDAKRFNVDICATGATTAPEEACLCGS